jgi:hypothetical protein
VDDLSRLTVVTSDRTAQDFVSLQDSFKRMAQNRNIQRTRHSDGDGEVVGSRGRMQLLEKPQPRLGEREWSFHPRIAPANGLSLRAR